MASKKKRFAKTRKFLNKLDGYLVTGLGPLSADVLTDYGIEAGQLINALGFKKGGKVSSKNKKSMKNPSHNRLY
tara:strand:+ start:949 stop:1170 length:222 start_codon:yes stop_codon:yes gene_type:complete